ncbi:hypothetical protein C6376_40160 [Streptomyces sp. P3]|nr:hypothetical protein C6376_40160 [Streptomyces sp. P3]
MAGYAPLAASAFLLLLTLGGTLLARLFPHRAVPCAQELETRIEELTGQLHRAHEQRSALGQGSAAEAHGHSPKAVRAWALRSGYSVPARGRIPVHILEAWRAAGGPTS